MASRDYRRYPGPFPRPPRGICRWCGLEIKNPDGTINRRRTFCGDICVEHYLLRSDPQRMRRHVFFRDGGKCRGCPKQFISVHGEWEADHIKPLVAAHGDPSFWEPENVRILCYACHALKTKADNVLFRRRPRRRRQR